MCPVIEEVLSYRVERFIVEVFGEVAHAPEYLVCFGVEPFEVLVLVE